MSKTESITTANVRSAAAVSDLLDRIAAATPAERENIRRELEALRVRPGVKSGQAGRIRAALQFVESAR